MKLLTLKCPSCGGQLSVEKGREYTFCQYCGTKILFDKDNEFTYRHIDDADIKRAETERIVRISELEMEKDNRGYRKALIVAWAAGTFFLFILGIILVAIGREGTATAGMMAMMVGMLVGLWGGIFVFTMTSNKSKQNNNNSKTARSSSNSNFNNMGNSPSPKRGVNLKYNMALNSTEATYGVTKTIDINRDELCRTCNGRGIINTTRCSECNGLGKHSVLKPLTVTIPSGVETGKMLIVKGEGEPGMHGGPNGDLYIEILVR